MNKRDVEKEFAKRTINSEEEWSFNGIRSIDRLTHGYHRYPAKFLPQLVKKIIEKYSNTGDIIADVFAGCGTTLVESKAHGLKSIGIDINPVAYLITNAKINPVYPPLLQQEIFFLRSRIKEFDEKENYAFTSHPKIDYWFHKNEKNKIAFLFNWIYEVDDIDMQNFFLCALSNILKNSSMWLQTGTKPQIDPNKIPADPIPAFLRQILKMQKKNNEFYLFLQEHEWLNTETEIKLANAKDTGVGDNSISTVITSPPYVTSYEYADIHQLTGYWLNYISDISSFRKNFIGTFYSNNKIQETKSDFANEIIEKLNKKDIRLSNEVANYFNEMYDVTKEIKRILKPNGVVCMVVGNTTMKDVRIKSAEAFMEMFDSLGLNLIDIIKRQINHKIIPTIRDKISGKFTKIDNINSQRIYPEEYILIAKN